jgi:hypothetical protein
VGGLPENKNPQNKRRDKAEAASDEEKFKRLIVNGIPTVRRDRASPH